MEYTERLSLVSSLSRRSYLIFFKFLESKSANPAGLACPGAATSTPPEISRISVDVGHGLSLGLGRALLAATRLLARCLLWRVLGRVGSTR